MRVYITVDTESSIAGAWEHPDRRPLEAVRHVFCRIDGEDFGIPLLTKLTSKYGLRATYFVETLATQCLGEADTKSIFDFLKQQEQDVQLHCHPVFRLYAEHQKARRNGKEQPSPRPFDLIGHLDAEIQMDLLREAIGHFESFAGYRPTAFRAGCFAGSRSMMRCLRDLGIRVDSSFNPCYHPHISFPGERLSPNLVQNIEEVWEIPVTVARTRLPEGFNGFKFADCSSLSFAEIRMMLDTAAAAGQEHFVIVFHSFSAVKAKDDTYAKMRPNKVVIRRLESMFRYLAENADRFQVDTMGNIAKQVETLNAQSPEPVVATLGMATAIARKAVQLVNNAYWV